MREEKFKINDVVWAKLTGFPWWPGLVLSILDDSKYEILYFGDFNRSFLCASNLKKFFPD